MATSLKYCPVSGHFQNCDSCQTLSCMDFFLYIIEDAKTPEEVRLILVTLEKLLVNQTKTTIIIDSFGSKLIESLKGRYDYIIAQNMQGNRMTTSLNLLLKQRKRGLLIASNGVTRQQVNEEITFLFREGYDKNHFERISPIPIRAVV